MALTDDLIAYWTMDETSGTRADSTGSGHTLSPTGTVGFATGIIDDAASFSGTGFLEDPGTMIASGSFSISGWYYGNWSGNNYTAFCQMEDGSDWDFKLTITEESLLSFSSTLGEVTTPTPSANEWHHIVVTFLNTGEAKLYVDGSLAQSGSIGSSIYLGGNNTFWVGTKDSFNEPYAGRIDETGVWTRVLTAEEVSALYNGGSGLPYPLELPPPENTVAPSCSPTSGTTADTFDFDSGTWQNTPTSWSWEYSESGADDWTEFSTDENPSILGSVFGVGEWDTRLTATNAGGSSSPATGDTITVEAVESSVATSSGGLSGVSGISGSLSSIR